MFLLKGSEGKLFRHRRWELDRWGPYSLTCRFRFDFLAELGTHTVVVGTDVVQTPGGQLVGVVKLQGSDQKGVRPLLSQVGLQEIKSHGRGQSNKRPRWLIQKPVVLTSVLTLATFSTPATCKCLTSSSHLWDMCTKNDHCIRSLKSALPPSPSPHTCPLMISGHGLWKAPACSRKLRCHLCSRKPQQQNPPCHMSELSWLGPVIWKRRLRHVWLSYTCPFGYIRRACNVGREGGSQTLHALSPFWEDAQDHGSWGSCVCKRPDAQKSTVNSPSCPQIWKVSHVPQSFCPGLFRTSVLLPVTLDAPLSSWTPETTACFLWGPCQRPEQSQEKSQHPWKLIQETLCRSQAQQDRQF